MGASERGATALAVRALSSSLASLFPRVVAGGLAPAAAVSLALLTQCSLVTSLDGLSGGPTDASATAVSSFPDADSPSPPRDSGGAADDASTGSPPASPIRAHATQGPGQPARTQGPWTREPRTREPRTQERSSSPTTSRGRRRSRARGTSWRPTTERLASTPPSSSRRRRHSARSQLSRSQPARRERGGRRAPEGLPRPRRRHDGRVRLRRLPEGSRPDRERRRRRASNQRRRGGALRAPARCAAERGRRAGPDLRRVHRAGRRREHVRRAPVRFHAPGRRVEPRPRLRADRIAAPRGAGLPRRHAGDRDHGHDPDPRDHDPALARTQLRERAVGRLGRQLRQRRVRSLP